ncbi:DUF2589 domain-containing protein [uncultured Campylobacter sp.]|uniref:DUF2589 domain-containing protein n=1 Tax=uncultured Campylobacter sp. TaxID=218934 RepID=UPI002628BDD1|nr:DUF2589 domain-containing protein [uncultured Campylobacter sp.]
MAKNTTQSLGDIIVSIAKAVAQAQSDVQESQLSHIFTFFKKKFKKDAKGNVTDELLPVIFPKSLKIGIPDSDAKNFKTKYYSVPYINLLPINQLHIESIKTEFDVSLVGLDEQESSKNEDIKDFDKLPTLKIDVVGGGLSKEKGLAAHISLTMSKHDLPEGTARMINELINNCQGYKEDLILRKEEEGDVK